jgi:hypothetical protein
MQPTTSDHSGGRDSNCVQTTCGRRRSRLPWISGTLAVACAALWLFDIDSPREWIAGIDETDVTSAELRILRQRPYFLFPLEPRESDAEFERFLEIQSKLARSHMVLNAVVRDPKYAALIPVGPEQGVDWLREAVEIDFRDREFMRIAVQGVNDSHAAALANAVAERYLRDVAMADEQRLRSRLVELTKLQDERKMILRRKLLSLKEYRESLGLSGLDAGSGDATDKLISELRSRIINTSIRLHAARAELALLDNNPRAAAVPESESREEIREAGAGLEGFGLSADRPENSKQGLSQLVRQLESEQAACEAELSKLVQKRQPGSSYELKSLQDSIRRDEWLCDQLADEIEKHTIELDKWQPRITLFREATGAGRHQ